MTKWILLLVCLVGCGSNLPTLPTKIVNSTKIVREKYQSTYDRYAIIVANDGSYFKFIGIGTQSQFARVEIGKPYKANWIVVEESEKE